MRSPILDRIGRNRHGLNGTCTAFVILSSSLSLGLILAWCGTAVVLGLDRNVLIPLCILAIGSLVNGLYPISFFEARLDPLTPNRIASVVDFGFLLLVLIMLAMGEIHVLSVAIVFASKWTLTAFVQWIYFRKSEPGFRWIVCREDIIALAKGIPHQAIFSIACTIPISSGILASQLGISPSGAGFLSLATMVQQAYILLSVQLHRIVQPRMVIEEATTQSHKHGDAMLRGLAVYLMVLGLVAWVTSSSVVWFFFPVEYRSVLNLLPWTILAGGLTSASYMASFQITMAGYQKYLTPVATFVAIVHIAFLLWVLRWGSVEAIAALGALSSGFSLLLLLAVLRQFRLTQQTEAQVS